MKEGKTKKKKWKSIIIDCIDISEWIARPFIALTVLWVILNINPHFFDSIVTQILSTLVILGFVAKPMMPTFLEGKEGDKH